MARWLREVGEGDRELEASVERDGDALERRVGLAGLRVGAERLLVREDVVGDEEAARLDLVPRELEEALVVLLLGVDEDDVEDVLDLREVAKASPGTSSTVSSRPASAMLACQASIFAGSASSESTRPPKWRTPAPSQIDE